MLLFLVSVLGTIIALLFALCGIVCGVAFFCEAHQGMSLSAFVQGFISAVWPLLAGCMQLALLEILRELHEAHADAALHTATPGKASPTPEREPRRHPQPAAPAAPQAAPVYFPVRETPQGPRIIKPQEQDTPTAPAPERELSFFKVD